MVIDGEKLKIAATIPLPNKVHEREIAKADTPDTFNSGATLGPINQTKMERIWTKHKQINPVRSKTPWASADAQAHRTSNGVNTTLKPKVFVAMSGGVDSSVAAALLKEREFNVVGIHIKMWSDSSIPCNFKEDRYDAMRVAEALGIAFQTWDFTEEYRREVVEYMIREYAAGSTPNPDVMCNRHIKFGVFMRRALEMGADFVATGHYVSIKYQVSSIKENGYKLLQAKDKNKDQSYFLWTLTQKRLRRCLFPIGEYTKPEVREMARKFGLPTAEKKDSQGICFIGEIDLKRFLQGYISMRPGLIETTGGRTIGEHEGLSFYTIGQRQGLRIGGGGIPYYVAEKHFGRNALVVAEGPYDERLFAREAAVADVNWISGAAPKFPLACTARIRYRQPLQRCVVNLQPTTYKLQARFDNPQRAVTPGQSIVFYRGEEMLGGGCIETHKVVIS